MAWRVARWRAALKTTPWVPKHWRCGRCENYDFQRTGCSWPCLNWIFWKQMTGAPSTKKSWPFAGLSAPRTNTISRSDSPCPCQGSPEEGRTSKIPTEDCRLWPSVCLLRAPLDDHKFGVWGFHQITRTNHLTTSQSQQTCARNGHNTTPNCGLLWIPKLTECVG